MDWHRAGQFDVFGLLGTLGISRWSFAEFIQALFSAAAVPRSSQTLRGLLSAPLPPRRPCRTHLLATTKALGISNGGNARQCQLPVPPKPETCNPDTDDGEGDERDHDPGEGVLAERPAGFIVVLLGIHLGEPRGSRVDAGNGDWASTGLPLYGGRATTPGGKIQGR